MDIRARLAISEPWEASLAVDGVLRCPGTRQGPLERIASALAYLPVALVGSLGRGPFDRQPTRPSLLRALLELAQPACLFHGDDGRTFRLRPRYFGSGFADLIQRGPLMVNVAEMGGKRLVGVGTLRAL